MNNGHINRLRIAGADPAPGHLILPDGTRIAPRQALIVPVVSMLQAALQHQADHARKTGTLPNLALQMDQATIHLLLNLVGCAHVFLVMAKAIQDAKNLHLPPLPDAMRAFAASLLAQGALEGLADHPLTKDMEAWILAGVGGQANGGEPPPPESGV